MANSDWDGRGYAREPESAPRNTSELSVYKCTNRKCSEHGKEVVALNFKAYRLATGRSPRCGTCREFLTWIKDAGDN